MAQNAYIGTWSFTTMTVRQLTERLLAMPPDAEVLFKLPRTGAFGPECSFTIEEVVHVMIPQRTRVTPAHVAVDEDTGAEYPIEEETQVWKAWSGVMLR